MKVCLFGNFDGEYSRNRVLHRGLTEAGVEVVICHTKRRGLGGILELMRAHAKVKRTYDVLIVAYSDDRYLVPLARALSRKPVVWDAFYSRFDTLVYDRALVQPRSIKAVYHWLSDWFSARLAHAILMDTDTHIARFCRMFRITKSKCVRVLVGAEDMRGNKRV